MIKADAGRPAEQRDLFRGQAERVAREIDRLQAQLSYLHWKAAMWDARDRGDARAEIRH